MIIKLDGYSLNMPVKENSDLRELSSEEYELYESVGIKRIFRDEKIFHGKDVNFAAIVWNVVIGATEGIIYKISLQNLSVEKDESEQIFKSAYECLFKAMGQHSEYNPTAMRYIWDTNEGNVVLDQAGNMGVYGVQVSFTSSIIRQQPEKYKQLIEAYKTAERAYKALFSLYPIGYKKMAISFWLFASGLIAVWFNFKIGLLLLFLGLMFFIWASFKQRRYGKLLMNMLIKQSKNKQDKQSKNE